MSETMQQPHLETESKELTEETLTTQQPIIENKEHLKDIVLFFGFHVFTNENSINTEILNFINQTFIDNDFFYNGKIIGQYDPDKLKKLFQTDLTNAESIHTKQRTALATFWNLYTNYYNDDNILKPKEILDFINKNSTSSKTEEIKRGEGTYGAVYKYYRRNKEGKIEKIEHTLVKYITTEESKDVLQNGELVPKYYKSFNVDVETNNTEIYQWMVEFCTFIIVMSILMFIDCTLIKDATKKNICLHNKYQNSFINPKSHKEETFLSYYSFMAKIHIPFAKKTEGTTKYLIGYIMEEYIDTLHDLYEKSIISPTTKKLSLLEQIGAKDNFDAAFNLTYQIFEILKKLTDLNNLGILFSHRDFTTKNIMYTFGVKNKYKIRLIDFGFLCMKINFSNGAPENASKVIGYHPYEQKYKIYECNKKSLDIILFLTWCLQYERIFFDLFLRNTYINIYEVFKNIVTLDKSYLRNALFSKDQNGEYKYDPWTYSAEIINEYEFDSNEIFDELFENMDKAIAYLLRTFHQGIEFGNYSKVEMYDIGDTKENGGLSLFLDTYKTNKQAYFNIIAPRTGQQVKPNN
jgi:hypothetical protein